MTDKLSSSERVEKAFIFISGLSRECRKGLTAKIERDYRGIAPDTIGVVVRKETEAWFAARDRNIRLSFNDVATVRPGEVRITYLGSTKDAHFKIHVDGQFTIVESSGKAYLKSINFNVDKKKFTR